MSGALLVFALQEPIGYTGMLVICLCFTLGSATLTYFYEFYKIDYLELANKIGFTSEDARRGEKFDGGVGGVKGAGAILDSPTGRQSNNSSLYR